jgi:hypothetical protein
MLVADTPAWETLVSVRTTDRHHTDDHRGSRRVLVLGLAALLAVDAALAYALYRGGSALF